MLIADLTTDQLLAMRRAGHINGCGPSSWKHHIPTPNCTPVCDQHDLSYWIGGTEEDRKAADRSLYDGMRRASTGQWGGAWLLARFEAWVFYRFVRSEGKSHFHYGAQRTPISVWPPAPPVGPSARSA